MTWTKLGREYLDEAYGLSDQAWRLHIEALMFSNAKLLDLLITTKDVAKFSGVEDHLAAIEELVATGWWERRGDALFLGCRFPTWQRTRTQVEHRRTQVSEAMDRKRRHDIGDHSRCLKTCKNAPLSDHTSDHESDVKDDDPERNGTERLSEERGESPNRQPQLEVVPQHEHDDAETVRLLADFPALAAGYDT